MDVTVSYMVSVNMPDYVLMDDGYVVGPRPYRNLIMSAMARAGDKEAARIAEQIEARRIQRDHGQMDIYDYAETEMA